MSTPTVYCFCSNNCRYETLTKEQAIAEIMARVTQTNPLEVKAISRIKELNKGASLGLWIGTKEEYEVIEKTPADDVLYIISDDNTKQEILLELEGIIGAVEALRAEFDVHNMNIDALKRLVEEAETKLAKIPSELSKLDVGSVNITLEQVDANVEVITPKVEEVATKKNVMELLWSNNDITETIDLGYTYYLTSGNLANALNYKDILFIAGYIDANNNIQYSSIYCPYIWYYAVPIVISGINVNGDINYIWFGNQVFNTEKEIELRACSKNEQGTGAGNGRYKIFKVYGVRKE